MADGPQETAPLSGQPRLRISRPRAGTIAIAVLVILIISLGYYIRAQPARYGEILGLDEFYMFRVSHLFLDNGLQLPEVDMMRNYPYGDRQWDYRLQLALPAYLFVLLQPLHPLFGVQGLDFKPFALLYPAIMAIVAIGAAYFAGKELFRNRWAGIFSAFFLAVLPGILTRTAAGGIEKEASAFPFILLSVWWFASAYNNRSWKRGILAGIFTGLIGSVWGGVQYFYIIYALFGLALVLINQESDRVAKTVVPTILIGIFIPQLQAFHPPIQSAGLAAGLAVTAIILIRYAAERFRLLKQEQLPYLVPGLLVVAVAALLVGSMVSDTIGSIIKNIADLLTLSGPQTTTVAESIAGDWNAIYSQVSLVFGGHLLPWLAPVQQAFSAWLFMFIGALLAVARLIKRDWMMAFLLIWFISGIYSVFYAIRLVYVFAPSAAFLAAYTLAFLATHAGRFDVLPPPIKEKLFYGTGVVFVLLGLLIATTMPFTAAAALGAGVVVLLLGLVFSKREKGGVLHRVYGTMTAGGRNFSVLFIPVALFLAFTVTLNATNGMAYTSALGPSINEPFYQAMDYLRTQTPPNASVISWWDFGYWFQTVGERASIADGGGAGETSRKDLANWFTANADNWSDWDWFLKNKLNVGYILMDYTLPGKYGAITKIESDGTRILGFLQFNPQPVSTTQRNNVTVQEFKADPYSLLLSSTGDSIADSPQLLVSQGNVVGSRAYVNQVCTSQGIMRLPAKQPEQPGCIALTSLGLFFVPAEAEFTIFSRLMFMDAAGLPVDKVFDNQLIKIYKVRYENESNPGAGIYG